MSEDRETYLDMSIDDEDQLQPGDTLDDGDLDDDREDENALDEQLGLDEADERTGRLVAPDSGQGEDVDKQELAHDVGIDGAGASAEEAAMHITREPEPPEGDDY